MLNDVLSAQGFTVPAHISLQSSKETAVSFEESANLSSAKCLSLFKCEMKSMPTNMKCLTGLEKLNIWGCPNIPFLQDLPSSLQHAYRLDCPAALNRLLQSGVPATVELRAAASASSSGPASTTASATAIAQCVQSFITAMDAVKLNMLANDQVRPLLQELSTSMTRLGPMLPPDFEGKVKVNEWLAKLHKMGAADELTEQQARQLNFDLDSAYAAFMAALPSAVI
ncbi:hypothetical protein PR202_gb04546 [Eleusine coracana subsp. coracana]|uniref:VPS28 C-terminal domain-containing protein n=1 Tax=Eleusine coracana subsp. coracana TaxID=191504 RepID=A0AAV5E416_ELECO|nr:hypothetical protein PR202_gb04546 [Eleusine coracana subsp. coracana]